MLNVTVRGTDNLGNIGQKATDVQRAVDADTPTLVSYQLYPEFPFTYENLTLNITCSNSEGDQVITAYWDVWNSSQKMTAFSGSQEIPNNVNVNITVISAENTSVNENWTLEVWCWDGLYYTTHKNTSTRRIGVPHFSKFNGSTTNFSAVADLRSVSGGATLEIHPWGKLIWLSTINVTDADFDTYVNITNNSIVVDTPNLGSSLNSSANLTLYNLTFTDPIILENNQKCTHCTKISYTQGNLTFNVSHFTSFSATENSNLTIWDDTDPEGGSQVKYVWDQVKFYANYTLTDGTIIDNTTQHNGSCEIKFNISGSWTSPENMTFNVSSQLYEYNRSFNSYGVYDYNVTCNSSNLISYLSALDNVTITNRKPYVILNSPLNDTWITLNSTLLNWTCIDLDNDTMTAYVYADNSTATPATSLINTTQNVVNGTSYAINWSALNETTYYWKVNCTDSGNLSNVSEIYQFTVDTIVPTEPIPTSPKNDSLIADDSPYLDWTTVIEKNFANYTVEVDDDPDFNSINYRYTITERTQSYYQVTDSWSSKTWYWRVIAYDKAGNFNISRYFIYGIFSHRGAPRISIDVSEDYARGELLTIFISIVNGSGGLANAYSFCNVTITHWNGQQLVYDLNSTAMTNFGTGRYYYNWQIPLDAQSGTYGILVKADPYGITTQTISGFHISEYTKEIENLWEKFQRFNTSVINNETIVSNILNSTSNITIFYNITIPLKEDYTPQDYLPVRWKYWFIDENDNCINQDRKQRFIEPYCNPLIAQITGFGNSTLLVNVTIRPSLTIGNYTIIRELEVDPQQIWISYGKGPVGKIEVLEDNSQEEPLIDASIIKDQEKNGSQEETDEQCIEVLAHVGADLYEKPKEREKARKIIGVQPSSLTNKERSSRKFNLINNMMMNYLFTPTILVLIVFILLVYVSLPLITQFIIQREGKKEKKLKTGKKDTKQKWYD
jgi:hypothetical protein